MQYFGVSHSKIWDLYIKRKTAEKAYKILSRKTDILHTILKMWASAEYENKV